MTSVPMAGPQNDAMAFLDRLKVDGRFQRQVRERLAGNADPNTDSVVAEIVNFAAAEGFAFGPTEYLAALAAKIDADHAAPTNMMSTCCCVHTSNTSSSHTRSLK